MNRGLRFATKDDGEIRFGKGGDALLYFCEDPFFGLCELRGQLGGRGSGCQFSRGLIAKQINELFFIVIGFGFDDSRMFEYRTYEVE